MPPQGRRALADRLISSSARVERADCEVLGAAVAMASDISVRVPLRDGNGRLDSMMESPSEDVVIDAVHRVFHVFNEVEQTCTRFDPMSPLSRMNAAPARWHSVPDFLSDAIAAAHAAYARTSGRFDPRVLGTLLSLGYRTSMSFQSGVVLPARPAPPKVAGSPPPWRPRFRKAIGHIHLGGTPIDLGGIGKGLAVRWSSQLLRKVTGDFLIEAGGDCYCAGGPSESERWRIGVEDPTGGSEPIAVLELRDRAVATSSTRLRRWHVGANEVHHLIDPATARPGGAGLLSVTVVAADPADAEVLSKVLFLEGADAIATMAKRRGIAALWVNRDGELTVSPSLGPMLLWSTR